MAKNRLTGCRCECPTCLEQFGSVRAFDRHRVGSFASPGTFQHHRRCLSPTEMLEAGWTRNPKGQWLAPDARRAGAPISGHAQEAATSVALGSVDGLLASPRSVYGPSKDG